MKFIIVAVAALVFAGGAKGAELKNVKKITIKETNNEPFFARPGAYVFEELQPKYLNRLKKYTEEKGLRPTSASEVALVAEVMAWVTSQWKHNGMNQPPSNYNALDILKNVHGKNQQYRCVEYGLVLSELLQAYGFVTRSVALRTPDVGYGGFGQGHVAMEVWINELSKWAFFDPQFGAYITKEDSKDPLSFYEMYLEKKNKKWPDLQIHFVNTMGNLANLVNPYKDFLVQYFGHMAVTSGKDTPRISLRLEGAGTPITFQGMPSDNVVFTDDAKVVYPQINRVTLLLKYPRAKTTFQEKAAKLGIKTNEDYLAKMAEFAAEPVFVVQALVKSPWFKNFEYRFDKGMRWQTSKSPIIKWDARKASSHLEVRAVNQFGRPGPATFIDLQYQ